MKWPPLHKHMIQALPNEIMMMTVNLPLGYHRNLQLIKEHIIPAFDDLHNCIRMTGLMLSSIQVKENLLADEKYKYLFSVEEVNKLVQKGVAFRDAYRKVGLLIEEGSFTYDTRVNHTHLGSIGNLGNAHIQRMMDEVIQKFQFDKAKIALQQLLS